MRTPSGPAVGRSALAVFPSPSRVIPARAEILEEDVWGALKSVPAVGRHDFPDYCEPSLGLGDTARADILEEDVWGALKSVPAVGRHETCGEH